MKIAHEIKARIFIKPEENEEELTKGFKEIVPYDLEEEKITYKETTAQGFEERKIKIKEIIIKKEKHTNKTIKRITEKLREEDKRKIREEYEPDEQQKIYLRIKKDSLNKEQYELTTGGDCAHLTITIAAYPKTKEKAKEIIKETFK